MLNERLLTEVCCLPLSSIWYKLRGQKFQNAMRFLREWQESLASYSKKHPYNEIQREDLKVQRYIERKIQNAFLSSKQHSYRRAHPLWPMTMVKQKAREDWDKFYNQIAY